MYIVRNFSGDDIQSESVRNFPRGTLQESVVDTRSF